MSDAVRNFRALSAPVRAVRRRLLLTAALCFGLGVQPPALAQGQLPVVATFSILGDMVGRIGGDRIALTTLVGPEADAHSHEPGPSDLQTVARARVLVSNGLAFEGWLPRLLQAARFSGMVVEASQGAELRRFVADDAAHDDHTDHHGHDGHDDHAGHARRDGHADHDDHGHAHEDGSVDPHAWQTLANGAVYARNIADALIAADPAGEAGYRQRLKDYLDEMAGLDASLKAAFAGIPDRRRKVVTSHDAFGYFSAAYGVQFIPVAGLAGHAETSASRMADIVKQVRAQDVAGIFLESGANARLVEQIARETGARVGGVLYSDALAAPGSPADTYLGMFRWNADELLKVMQPGG